MIQFHKLPNLKDLQLLYNDLRDRIKAKYTKPAGGIPASDLAEGVIPNPQSLIDDTAAASDKTYSSNKTESLINTILESFIVPMFPVVNSKYTKPPTGIPASDLADDAVPVKDVKINGTSVLQNGVANVPKGSSADLGVVKARYYGVRVNNDGELYIYPASITSEVKQGASNYLPIVPSTQHASVFYGLAKLAGADMAQSSNTVGTYTDAAKQAIQKLFGLAGMLGPYEDDITADRAYAIGETFIMDGKRYKATAAIAQGGIITPGTNCELDPLDGRYVRNTDIATTSHVGVVKVGDGFSNPGDGTLNVDFASADNIKAGAIQRKSISPYQQHRAVFYGLAKLAGIDLASSDTPLGTYTAEAKAAILAMLGAVSSDKKADSSNLGLVMVGDGAQYGVTILANGMLRTLGAYNAQIKAGTDAYRPIVPEKQDVAVFYGLSKLAGEDLKNSDTPVGTYPQASKTAIQSMLGIEADIPLVETVSGSTPSITGMPNVRYICGTCSTLAITPPSAGSIVVRFDSGSSPTILTVPSTVKFPAWFDYTALEANTTYEIIITDGVYGGVMSWAI